MKFQDYYKILGVERDAAPADIKTAFRKAARKYHPDINPGAEAEARFKEVNEAYEVLGDPERRAAYDELGRAPPQDGARYQPPPDWSGSFSFSGGGPGEHEAFSDFFEALFRRSTDPGDDMRGVAGADSHARIEIALEDAYRGVEKMLTLRTPVVGPEGSIEVQERSIAVRIPKGVAPGQHIRLPGQGAPAPGQRAAGDLFLEVTFAPHPVYRVDGADLFMDLPVAPWEAALGTQVILPTPAGKVDLRIPKNARTGQKLRLKGKGLPGRPAGDIYATLKIVNPDASTPEARAFFEQMARDLPFDPRARLGG
ncbi:DnaJ C-terminal domain-containing protein [Roseobacter sinensis]|uniref:DnaJ domain-containing protein n=1 Tax=Roseobacter sinensis TaxID=2931391 RepID=A0ABT3BD45_9RHOB|nr:DnaJ C-terminal domain-containing protein [Roseobacter sp. WL0113]MCV3271482.1 DnaJ domain-containing protein [Roseobacter sp. WL0113]